MSSFEELISYIKKQREDLKRKRFMDEIVFRSKKGEDFSIYGDPEPNVPIDYSIYMDENMENK